jgi:hypothetical protein
VGVGVAGDVGQRLGDDPQGGHLHRRRQRRQHRRRLQGAGHAITVEPVHLLSERPVAAAPRRTAEVPSSTGESLRVGLAAAPPAERPLPTAARPGYWAALISLAEANIVDLIAASMGEQ